MSRRCAMVTGVFALLATAACGASGSQPSSASGGATPPGGTAAPTPAANDLPAPVVDVTTLGCRGDGATDCTGAIGQAVQKVDAAGGGTVFFPAGRFALHGPANIDAGKAIYIAGAGRDRTTLIETGNSQLLRVRRDGVVVQDLTLDTQTHNARAAIVVVANHTTLRRAHVLGGDQAFALYYAGPPGATPYKAQYNVGNQVLDTTVDDRIQDDGFSWSFQQDGVITNIQHTGSRLALYIDKNVVVTNYVYTPGIQAPHATDGFYITPPSDSVTIQGFTSNGSGGIIGTFHATRAGSGARISTNITITGEKVLQNGYRLSIGDVQSLTLSNCSFAGSDQVLFKPALVLQHVHVQNCTIPSIAYAGAPAAQLADLTFTGDVFPAFAPGPGQDAHTFALASGTAPPFVVQGGTLTNRAGLMAGGLTGTVSGLAGYP